MRQPLSKPRRSARSASIEPFFLALFLGLGLALSACGGDKDEAVDGNAVEDQGTPAEAEGAGADSAAGAGDGQDAAGDAGAGAGAAGGTDAEGEAADAAPSPTDEPSEVPTEAPTDAPTAVPATLAPTKPPAPTKAPATEWFVEFYPDNWSYQIPKDQLCAGVNWRSAGVTDLVFGRVGFASEPVEAEGRKGDICFPESEASFFLEYKKPDGQVERKEFQLERTKNKG